MFCQQRRDAPWNTTGVSSATPRQTKDAKKQHKPKSTMKRQRDTRRYVTFVERKSVCVAMPFYDVSNTELPKLLPKLTCVKIANNAKMVSQLSIAQTEISKQQSQLENVKSELASARKDISNLKIEKENYETQFEDFQNETVEICAENKELQRTVIILRQ